MTENPFTPDEIHQRETFKDLAGYSDRQLANRFDPLIGAIPELFHPEVDSFFATIQEVPQVQNINKVFFIPIHHHFGRPNEGKTLGTEVKKIIQEFSPKSTLVVSGENDTPNFTLSTLKNDKNAQLQLLTSMGNKPSVSLIEPWEAELADLVKYSAYKAAGLDAGGMVKLSTMAAIKPQIVGSRLVANELFYVTTEGRTRYALNKAANTIQPNQDIVLIQGLAHGLGAITWGERNGVDVQFITPPSLQAKADYYYSSQ